MRELLAADYLTNLTDDLSVRRRIHLTSPLTFNLIRSIRYIIRCQSLTHTFLADLMGI